MFLEEIEEKRRSRLKIIEEHVKNGVEGLTREQKVSGD